MMSILSLSFNSYSASLDLELSDEEVVTEPEESISSNSSPCLEQYRKYRNSTAIKTGLAPVVGLAGLARSGMLALGWEYGGWVTFKAAIGPILTSAAGTAINFVIPTSLFGGYVVYETVMISRFVKASKAYRLVKGLYLNQPNKQLDLLVDKVQRKRPDLSNEEIRNYLIEADQTGALCDGSWVRRKWSLPNKYKNLSTLKDMEKNLLLLTISPSNELY